MKRFNTIGVVAALMLFVACSGGNGNSEKERAEQTSDNHAAKFALEFAVRDLSGRELRSEELAGNVVVVDFWATWCQPCLREIPEYNKLYEKYRDRNVRMLGITLDSGDATEVEPYVEKYKIAYPIFMGNDEIVSVFGGIQFYPTTFVLDQKGNVVKKYIGGKPGKIHEIDQIIEDLLNAQG